MLLSIINNIHIAYKFGTGKCPKNYPINFKLLDSLTSFGFD